MVDLCRSLSKVGSCSVFISLESWAGSRSRAGTLIVHRLLHDGVSHRVIYHMARLWKFSRSP